MAENWRDLVCANGGWINEYTRAGGKTAGQNRWPLRALIPTGRPWAMLTPFVDGFESAVFS